MKNNDPLTFAIMLMTIVVAMWACTQIVNATDLTHRYKNPSFSGIGTSAHYLTIENQERTRSDAIREKRVSDEDKRQAALKNTNYAKFIKNLESRIYARFSKEMEDALFGEKCGTSYSAVNANDTAVGTATAPGAAVTDNETGTAGGSAIANPAGNCSGTMTFNGTTINFTKDNANDKVTLVIDGPDGNSTIEMPLNDFKF